MNRSEQTIIQLFQNSASPLKIAITGDRHIGKTTALMEIYQTCRQLDMDICGFIEKAIFENGQRAGYEFVDLETGETCAVARKKRVIDKTHSEQAQQMGYEFYDAAWEWAAHRIFLSQSRHILIADELGRLEAQNLGLMPALCLSLQNYPRHLIAAVRGDALDRIESRIGKFDSIVRL